MKLSLQWFPLLPPGVIVAVCVALLAALAYGSWLLRQKQVPRRWIALLAALRIAMVAVLLLALLQPVVNFPQKFRPTPDVAVLVDTSASMAQPAGGSGASRFDEVRRLLADSPALQDAAAHYTLHWFQFDRRAQPTTGDELRDAKPVGDSTDLSASLTSAWNHVRLLNASTGTGGPPRRALVVSDGQDLGTADAAATARDLGLAIDVLPPSRADAAQPTGAATIADVQCGRRVLLGAEAPFQVTLRADEATEPMTLVVEQDGREVQCREIGALAAGSMQHVVLAHRPTDAGLKSYAFRLARGETALGRPYTVNVQVTDQKQDVLILEDTWRWEFKYFRRVLEDDPNFSFTALLSRGGQAMVQFGEAERRVQLSGMPQSRGELDGFETIILGDVNTAAWPRNLARHINHAVTEQGKSLIVIAGPRLGELLGVPEIASLLPVELRSESGSPVSGRVDVRVRNEGAAAGWFALDLRSRKAEGAKAPAAAEQAGSVPAKLPSLEHVYPVLRKRPAATVLLEAVGHSNDYGPLIVMAEHTAGRGRVLFVGTDTLWRWQTVGPRGEDGTTLYALFWQQALRAMAPAEPTSDPVQLWIRPEQTRYLAGERVEIGLECLAGGERSQPTVRAAVVLPDGRRVPLDLRADGRTPNHFAASFEATAVGRHRIEASAANAGSDGTEAKSLANASTVIEVAPRARSEADVLPVDTIALSRLAATTGGRVVDPSAVEGWLPSAPPEADEVVRQTPLNLWHNFTLLLVLCGIMATDWLVRLFRGYT